MRVVAGSLRGRRIDAPDTPSTRPTTDKVREAVFNALGSLGEIEGARVVDLFAGSGAMGIEALSRGAAHCTFVENDRRALAVLRRNLEHLGVAAMADVVDSDALAFVSRRVPSGATDGGIDLLIADPPYGFGEWSRLLDGADAGLVVIESDREPEVPRGWEMVRSKRYGRTHVAFLRHGETPGGTVGTR